MRIVFMGTPGFAVASLEALIEAGEEVVAVVTVPDRPAGRGQKLMPSAVKTAALNHGIPVLQPEKLRDPEFLEELKSYQADLQIVVAFRMLPEVVWNMPPHGTVNLHASLLPQYRGAAPINHAIWNGDQETGVTTFKLKHEIDTGDILFSESTAIAPDETAGELHDRLMEIGAKLLVKTVRAIAEGVATSKPQDGLTIEGERKEAPKIFKEHTLINWNNPAQSIYNQIRALSPYPGAFTMFQGKVLKIYKAKLVPAANDNQNTIQHEMDTSLQPGSYTSDGKSYLRFAANDGYIDVLELQAEGKRKMEVAEFLRGVRL